MDVRNCKMCGAIFNFDGSPLCPKCRRKMEEKFSVVKEYILKNPSSSISSAHYTCLYMRYINLLSWAASFLEHPGNFN